MISRIGKYTVEAELGHGGFGQVYKAWDPDVRQSVAIKVLLAQGDTDVLRRFQLEVVTTASLHHKNIVTIHASGEEAGTPYLVMELLEGQTLGQIIKNQVALSLMEKVRIMTQVAEGLAYAHSKGVVHRDVKPANIMLLPDGQVKIMDFGIALATNRMTATMTMDGFVVGTLPYMAPEQFSSEGKANEQTDLFSYGDVYYELLTGSHPFEPFMRDLSGLRMAILSHDPPPVSQRTAGCPEALELLVHRSLAKEREFRYQTFEELHFDSASILVDLQHDQAEAILRDVPPLLARGELQQARVRIREAQKLEPGNRQARQMLESIDQKLHETVNRDRVAARLSDAEKQIAERRFAEAVQNLENAARLDTTNIAVQRRLADAKARLAGATQANRLVEDARARQQKGELAEALDRLNRALQIDPEHTEAKRMFPRVREMLMRSQTYRLRQQGVDTALAHLAGKRFAEALAAVAELEKQEPGDGELADLRRRIEAERGDEERRVRAERFHLALSRTRETMQAGELERAAQMLAHLNSNFAGEPGAAEILPLLRQRLEALRSRGELTASQLAERIPISEFLTQKAASEGTGFVSEPQRTSFHSMFETRRNPEDVAAVLKRSNNLRESGDLRGALAAIAEGRRRLGDDPAFVERARGLEGEIEKKRRAAGLRDFLDAIRELVASGLHAEAVARLTKAKEFAGEPEVMALLEAERAQLPDRTRATSVGEQRGGSTAKHRSAILHEIEAQNWSQAQAAIRKARSEYPEERAFDELAEQVEAGLREQGLYEAVSRIKAKLADNNVPEAVAQLEITRPIFSRDERWKAVAEEVSRHVREGKPPEASDKRAGDLPVRVQEQRVEAPRADRAPGRKDPITGIADKVRVFLSRDDIRQAAMELGAARTKYPDEGLWAELKAEIDERQTLLARKTHVAAIAERVSERLKRGALRQAGAELGAARAKYPDEELWDTLQVELDKRQLALDRQTKVDAMALMVRERLKRYDVALATAELNAARATYPGEEMWAALQKEIEALKAKLRLS